MIRSKPFKRNSILKKNWRVNDQIIAATLRVIGPDSKQIGVLSRSEAMQKAKELGADLVEIASGANPPVAKIVDFGKFKYHEEKKLKKELKNSKGGEQKEVRFSPFIADNDYNTRLNRIKEFLKDKNKVRIAVVFTGRQMNSKQFGYDLLRKILDNLGDTANVDSDPKFLGRHLAMVISPNSKSKDNAKTKNKKISDNPVQSN